MSLNTKTGLANVAFAKPVFSNTNLLETEMARLTSRAISAIMKV